MANKTVPIFYACDDNFVKYTIVSLHSIIKNASKDRKYEVYVLHTSITERMQGELKKLENEHFTISFSDVSEYISMISKRLPIRHYYTKTTYFRFFIADMFPQYDKAIYIDSDTVVNGDISKLYDTDIGDFYVGACHEQVMVQTKVYGDYCEEVVGVDRGNFFNAGMMLINCDTFRKKKLMYKFFEYLGVYNFVVTQDEDYLNLICKDHVFWLDQRWNTEVCEHLSYPYDEREAYILHYIMTNKPWHYEDCKCSDIFHSYARETDIYPEIRAELEGYTDEQKERDRLSGENLYRMALDEIAREDNFLKTLNKTKRSADRVRINEKIRDYEREGKFDVDVEDDPPTKPLLPDEIDYKRRSVGAKLRTFIAHCKAKRFLNYITRHEKLIVKEIRGIENFKALTGGAVITCNHFNALDSFAMHVAYTASGKKKKMYRVIREGNYTSFPGFYGYLMRNFYTLPLSSNLKTLAKFTKATDELINEGNYVLFYPEGSMWYNYRKPKPLKPGAYRFAVKNGVPVLPCFITMRDSDILDDDGYFVQEYTIHIAEPIYPRTELSYKENLEYMANKNYEVWKEIYEREYSMPLVYTTVKA